MSDGPGDPVLDPDPLDRFPDVDGMPLAALRRYVTGVGEPEERQRIDAWAAERVDRRRYLAALRHLYERASGDARDEARGAWARIADALAPPSARPAAAARYVAPWERPVVDVDLTPRPARVLRGAFVRGPRPFAPAVIAAASIALAFVGVFVMQRLSPRPAAHPTASVMRLIATAKGQRAEIRLADGSRVVLGVDSRLHFASDFGDSARDLYLDGTAYFDVVHDSTRPLRIHTSNAVTEDVGTRFVVTAYRASGGTQVVVESGTVTMRPVRVAAASRVELTAGDMGRLAPNEAVPAVRVVDTAAYTAWMRGRLDFRDAPLSDVVAELRRWYDVDVRIGDASLGAMPLSASFDAESFRQALLVVTTVLPVRASRHGDVVTLYHR